jgi:H+/Cl- antiporter ClcA
LVIAAFCNPIGMENIGYKYYIVFCCLLAVFLAVTYFVFPETKGRSLEEIAEIFDGPRAVVDTRASEKELNRNLYEEQIEERIERA